ncbi:MAG: hypothetical protein WBI28_00680 [Candidatus Omnitrophota bacterium]|jgi:uncharacterized protein YceK
MRKNIAILFLSTVIFLNGCAAIIASQFGYAQAKNKYSPLYDDYRVQQDQTGEPAKEFNDWIKDQPLTSNEIKVFKIRGVISSEEAKAIRERDAVRLWEQE